MNTSSPHPSEWEDGVGGGDGGEIVGKLVYLIFILICNNKKYYDKRF